MLDAHTHHVDGAGDQHHVEQHQDEGCQLLSYQLVDLEAVQLLAPAVLHQHVPDVVDRLGK